MAQEPAAPHVDRRSSPRCTVRPGVAVEVRRLKTRDNVARLALNISIGGLCVVTSEPLEAGVFVEVFLSGPGLPEPLHVAGRVAWCTPAELDPPHCHVGVAFIRKLSADDLTTLVSH